MIYVRMSFVATVTEYSITLSHTPFIICLILSSAFGFVLTYVPTLSLDPSLNSPLKLPPHPE